MQVSQTCLQGSTGRHMGPGRQGGGGRVARCMGDAKDPCMGGEGGRRGRGGAVGDPLGDAKGPLGLPKDPFGDPIGNSIGGPKDPLGTPWGSLGDP